MKKLVTAALVVMMSASAMAATLSNATITTIKVRADGTVGIVVTPDGGGIASLLNLDGVSADAQKNIIAALLTAKASGSTADIRYSNGTITEVGY